jgi:diguanylate cyclase (GGDEF)-like protein/PAS domain S-box-containing protein
MPTVLFFMPNIAQSDLQSDPATLRREGTSARRSRPVSGPFVHHDPNIVESSVQEMEKAQFIVSADVVSTVEEFAEHIGSHSYDVILAECSNTDWKGSQALELLHQRVPEIPLIFLTTTTGSKSVAQLIADGAFDYVEREHLAQLPMVVRRVMNETKLREELEEVRTALQHSQSLYRALLDNPAYGIYRCAADGELLDVNQTLVTMLGYASKEELLATSHKTEVFPTLGQGVPFTPRFPEATRTEPVEIEWKRKDGATLKARLSGRGIYDDDGDFAGHEVIVVDVTDLRTLEEQLRHQASSDSLTGLANHRRLFEVLHAEICRSKRTGREFSLVLLDLDGLKQVNDRYGHPAGDRALIRLGQILKDCCRSVDTVARHGGDEFALVLPETGVVAATSVAERICERLEREAEKPALSVSVGIAAYPKNAETIGTLLYAADAALYAMKAKRPRAARNGPSSIHEV